MTRTQGQISVLFCSFYYLGVHEHACLVCAFTYPIVST